MAARGCWASPEPLHRSCLHRFSPRAEPCSPLYSKVISCACSALSWSSYLQSWQALVRYGRVAVRSSGGLRGCGAVRKVCARDGEAGGGKAAADLRLAADKQFATDARAASRNYATAVSADPKSAESWLGLARALLAIKVTDENSSERYDLPVNASGAAYRAYELATDKTRQAEALAVLGEAMQRRAYWRPAIDAYRISLELAEAPAVRADYEKLRAEHGFRMTDYKTDTEALRRACAQCSREPEPRRHRFCKIRIGRWEGSGECHGGRLAALHRGG